MKIDGAIRMSERDAKVTYYITKFSKVFPKMQVSNALH